VTVWRRLQQAGAVSVGQGMWMLPQTPNQERFFVELLQEIQAQGGNGLLLVASVLDTPGNEQMIRLFQEERDRDNTEFADRCDEFFREIEKETQTQHWSFVELEEIEEDFAKLTRWLRTIQHRDFFPGPQSEEATRRLSQCRQMLDVLTRSVYTSAGLSPKDE